MTGNSKYWTAYDGLLDLTDGGFPYDMGVMPSGIVDGTLWPIPTVSFGTGRTYRQDLTVPDIDSERTVEALLEIRVIAESDSNTLYISTQLTWRTSDNQPHTAAAVYRFDHGEFEDLLAYVSEHTEPDLEPTAGDGLEILDAMDEMGRFRTFWIEHFPGSESWPDELDQALQIQHTAYHHEVINKLRRTAPGQTAMLRSEVIALVHPEDFAKLLTWLSDQECVD